MPAQKLKSFLDDNKIRYIRIIHSPAYTSQEIAASAHVPGKEMAKTVMVRLDGNMAMAVLPAMCQVDLEKLREATDAGKAEIATEQEFRDAFPECEVGAMPPFGNLYGMDVVVDKLLAEDEMVAFNAGSHSELLKMDFADYQRLVNPAIADIAD